MRCTSDIPIADIQTVINFYKTTSIMPHVDSIVTVALTVFDLPPSEYPLIEALVLDAV